MPYWLSTTILLALLLFFGIFILGGEEDSSSQPRRNSTGIFAEVSPLPQRWPETGSKAGERTAEQTIQRAAERIAESFEEDSNAVPPFAKDLGGSSSGFVPVQVRPESLIAALDQGTVSSLQVLREERLQKLSNYQEEILPLLKREGLQSLLSRFRERDFARWGGVPSTERSKPTKARLYIDNVFTVHPELGIFLETAAQIFHALFRETGEGRVFHGEAELQSILQRGEKLLSHRVSSLGKKAVLSSDFFSPEVFDNIDFYRLLEEYRGRFVLNYLEQERNYGTQTIVLLGSLAPKQIRLIEYQRMGRLFGRFALYGTAGLREQLLEEELEQKSLRPLARENLEFRSALANLYAVSAVDALEGRYLALARRLLQESIALQPGLKTQRLVEQFLASHSVPFALPAQKVQEEEFIEPVQTFEESPFVETPAEAEVGVFGQVKTPSAESTEKGGGIPWGSLFALLGIGGGLLYSFYRILPSLRERFTGSPVFDASSQHSAAPFDFDQSVALDEGLVEGLEERTSNAR